MVKLEELSGDVEVVEDGADLNDSEYETEEEAEEEELAAPENETLLERIYALADIIPPARRADIAKTSAKVYETGLTVAKFVGSATWIIVTGAILLVLPVMLEVEKEQAVIAQENQMKLSQQQVSAQQLLQPGPSS
ncbi:mitochondrial outer membrane translocase complex, subunit Tom22 [Hyaloraphidium curvatum]|nr:mitochondrial outer membrane translocase complex, subunit Tom22 [Hyaloraphidium curvatum]